MRSLSSAEYGRAELASDYVMPTLFDTVPGLTLSLPAGLYKVNALVDMTSYSLAAFPRWSLIATNYSLMNVHTVASFREAVGEYNSSWGMFTGTEIFISSYGWYTHGRLTYDGYVRLSSAGTISPRVGMSDVLVNDPGAVTTWNTTNASAQDEYDGINHSPDAATKIIPDGGSEYAEAYRTIDSDAIHPGRTYEFKSWLYSPSGWSDVRLGIYSYFGGSQVGVQETTVSLPAATWTQVTVTAAPPNPTSELYFGIQIHGSPTDTDVVYFDDTTIKTLGVSSTVGAGSFITATPL